MPDPKSEPDPRLEDIQERVDAVRNRLADNPGLDVVDKDHVPAYFEDDVPEEGVPKSETPDGANEHDTGSPA